MRYNPFRFRLFAFRGLGVLRVTAYVLGAAALVAFWGTRQVHASLGERVLALGNETRRLGVVDAELNKLRVNGVELSLSLMVVDAPVAEVLERYQGACDSGASNLRELWSNLPRLSATQQRELKVAGMSPGSGAFRFDKEDAGVVLCFVDPPGAPPRTLLQRFQSMALSSDLSHFGALRYVSARRTGQRTQLTLLDSEGSLNLMKLVGDADGDVEGEDPTNIARPPSARRAFSASVVGAPYNYNLYTTAEAPATILQRYDSQLLARGWERMAQSPAEEQLQRVYIKPMSMVVALAAPTDEGTLVSLMETSREQPSPAESSPRARVEE